MKHAPYADRISGDFKINAPMIGMKSADIVISYETIMIGITSLAKKEHSIAPIPTTIVTNLEDLVVFSFVLLLKKSKSNEILELSAHRIESAVDSIAINIAAANILVTYGFVKLETTSIKTLLPNTGILIPLAKIPRYVGKEVAMTNKIAAKIIA